MKDRIAKQARHEYTPGQRAIFLIFLAPIFLFLLPLGLIALGKQLDGWLGLPFVLPEPSNLLLGLVLILSGLGLAWWTMERQFTLGRGTPVPVMATQNLVVQPPYTYCRNPMALGTFVAYLGAGLLFHSIGAVIAVLFFAVALMIYIKLVEEREMEARFGQAYLDYKQRTPFLVPRPPRK